MSRIDILSMNDFPGDGQKPVVDIAFPVLAIECEARPPMENYLDAYEDAALKFISIGTNTPKAIAQAMGMPQQSLAEKILDRLRQKGFSQKPPGRSWELTKRGGDYLSGTVQDEPSKQSQYGYMFVNTIKKEVIPFFWPGDIQSIPLFAPKGRVSLDKIKITVEGDEEKTFQDFDIRPSSLRKAYRAYLKLLKDAPQKDDSGPAPEAGNEVPEELEDPFGDLEDMDEWDQSAEQSESAQAISDWPQPEDLKNSTFIRRLKCEPRRAYLHMQIIIDLSCLEGYDIRSPFLRDDPYLQNRFHDYFLQRIQWLADRDTVMLGQELFGKFLTHETQKFAPSVRVEDKNFSVFVLEKMPLLKVCRVPGLPDGALYHEMEIIYEAIQRRGRPLDKSNIVNNISSRVVEKLFNSFFKESEERELELIAETARRHLETIGCEQFLQELTRDTWVNPAQLPQNEDYLKTVLGRLRRSRGNSMGEKFINLLALNYYSKTPATSRFFSAKPEGPLYERTVELGHIRNKTTHDTDQDFTQRDYEFYMAHVFELINALLEAYRED